VKLSRRLKGLARWQDCELAEDWAQFNRVCRDLNYEARGLLPGKAKRWSGRQGRELVNDVVTGTLFIEGELDHIWPVLFLGQFCHAGRSSTSGQGRYSIEIIERPCG